MEHPEITRALRTGYPDHMESRIPPPPIRSDKACHVCEEYEAEIKYNNTLLCLECCKDVDIKIL